MCEFILLRLNLAQEVRSKCTTLRPKLTQPFSLPTLQDEVELGIQSLLRAREQDPYLDPATRLLYERVKGEAAPTFPASVLDAAVLRTKLARRGKRRRQSQSQRSGAPVTTEKPMPVESTIGAGARVAAAEADKLADKVTAVASEPTE